MPAYASVCFLLVLDIHNGSIGLATNQLNFKECERKMAGIGRAIPKIFSGLQW